MHFNLFFPIVTYILSIGELIGSLWFAIAVI